MAHLDVPFVVPFEIRSSVLGSRVVTPGVIPPLPENDVVLLAARVAAVGENCTQSHPLFFPVAEHVELPLSPFESTTPAPGAKSETIVKYGLFNELGWNRASVNWFTVAVVARVLSNVMVRFHVPPLVEKAASAVRPGASVHMVSACAA